jgi:small subunit ribosomal protein S8
MDKIADMLTQIRNAQMAGHNEVLIKTSKIRLSIAKILEKEGFVSLVMSEKIDDADRIKITLKYHKVSNMRKAPAIQGLRRISREGQRIYIKNKDIRTVKNKFGIAILSTSKGLMTGEESRKLGIGGEYICEVW